ncbi:hypothetical protein F5884DRAFT_309253 [Xylogone sp. PMI_703]|nr:hypothetical protein F5884DRAFT_309253 [Xylogone sp. PMI_703]
MSRHIGMVDRRLDNTNRALVSRTLEIVDMSHFPDPWEKERSPPTYPDRFRNTCALRGDIWILDANQLLLARKFGIIDKLPRISDDNLSDRNKGDFFVELIALAQIVWFLVQLGVRLTRHILFPSVAA